jgi:hypothetical protein
VNLFITSNFLEYVCEQTNVYVNQVISAAPCPFTKHSQIQTLTPVTLPELKKFLGLMFVNGIISKPTLKFYWSEYPVFETPVFTKTMTRNHFESIWPFLYFNDSSKYDINNQLIPSDYLYSQIKK